MSEFQNKVASWIPENLLRYRLLHSLAHVSSNEICKIFDNIYFEEHLRTAASAELQNNYYPHEYL